MGRNELQKRIAMSEKGHAAVVQNPIPVCDDGIIIGNAIAWEDPKVFLKEYVKSNKPQPVNPFTEILRQIGITV